MDSKKKPSQKKAVTKKQTSKTREKKTTTKIQNKAKLKQRSYLNFNIIAITLVSLIIILGLIFLFLNKEQSDIKPQVDVSKNETANKTEDINKTVIDNATLIDKNITDIDNDTIVASKPYLVIIIDDVVFKSHIKHINEIPLKLSPSFLPPTSKIPDSNKNTKYANFYMVHLPLEALNFKDQQEDVLYVSDTYEELLQKLTKIKKQFPQALFYNGHTGSKFTSDYDAMDRLYKAMDELGIVYVESKTISNTMSKKIAKKYHKKLLERDVFLDHEVTEEFITNQLLLAIKLAKERGHAIAIGHPHKETLQVLKNSVDLLNSEVEVIYLKDLYNAKN